MVTEREVTGTVPRTLASLLEIKYACCSHTVTLKVPLLVMLLSRKMCLELNSFRANLSLLLSMLFSSQNLATNVHALSLQCQVSGKNTTCQSKETDFVSFVIWMYCLISMNALGKKLFANYGNLTFDASLLDFTR